MYFSILASIINLSQIVENAQKYYGEHTDFGD